MGAGDASQFTRNTVRVGNLSLSYLKGGRGEPLLYLHGLSGWGRWESHHLALGITNMVYAVELPGWHDGRMPAEITSVRDYASVLAGFLDALGLDAVDLVGHSIGGWIALYIAAEYSSRVSRLVLIDSMGLHAPEEPAADLGAMDQEAFLRAAFVELGTVVVRGDFGGAVEVVRNGQEFEKQWRSRGIVVSLARGRNADPELTQKLKAIDANTLIVWGREDRIVPWRHGQLLAQMIPRSRFALIDHAGHTPMRDKRETFQRIVRDFLAGEESS